MKIIYLMNRYPAVSHSFIRREILELERSGVQVERVSVRGWSEPLPDPRDIEERKKTFFILKCSALQMALSFSYFLTLHPIRFFRAFAEFVVLALASDRGFRSAAYFVEACVVARYALKKRAEHIHAHFGTNSTDVAMLAGMLSAIEFSFTVHGPEEFDRGGAISLRRKVERAKFVVGISDYTRSQIWRQLPLGHWEKVLVLRCGVDSAHVRPDAPAVQSARFLSVGRLVEQKGHAVLLEAIACVQSRGFDVELHIIGDGPLRATLESLARRLRISERVVFHGAASEADVLKEMRESRAVVVPSFAEGLPVVIVEAFSVGRPVIASWVSGIPELVDQSCGWLVAPGDVRGLADALVSCLEASMDQLLSMGESGAAHVESRHNLMRETKKLAEAFAA